VTQEVKYLLKMTAKFFECCYGDGVGVGVFTVFNLWDDKQTLRQDLGGTDTVVPSIYPGAYVGTLDHQHGMSQ